MKKSDDLLDIKRLGHRRRAYLEDVGEVSDEVEHAWKSLSVYGKFRDFEVAAGSIVRGRATS